MPGDPVSTVTESSPGNACAEQGFVLLEGRGGMAVAFTPDAAERTAQNLLDAAREARLQRGPCD